MPRLLILLLLCFKLAANDQSNQAEAEFAAKHYEKAFELYAGCISKKNDPEAAYKIGRMYEYGWGVDKDYALSTYWYKTVAQWELDDSNRKKVYEVVYANMDPLKDEESTKTLIERVNGKFALRAYETNYMITTYSDVIGHGDKKFEENSPSQNPSPDKYIPTELQYQISFRADYMSDWFGFSQMWSAAYTQVSYWQIFINSAPFRETNYKPELFVTIPFFHKADAIGLKAVSFGFKHSSNGQAVTDSNRTRSSAGPMERSRSRSWNRLYTRAYFQWSEFFGEIDIWHRMEEPLETDDNPDIEDYYGPGQLSLGYIHNKFLTELKVRPSFSKGWVSAELSMSYPTLVSKDVYFYLRAFSGVDGDGNIGGYGSSLIDYDQQTNKIGFGLSISR